MESKRPRNNNMPKAPKPKYAGSIRKYYKRKEEKEWYFLCGCGKKGVNYYDYRPCLQCDVCKVWKHVKCVGFAEEVTKLSNEMRKKRIWVCSDCKAGNFKFLAKLWLKDELLNREIDRVKKQVRSLSDSDDFTKSNFESELFEKNLAKKKEERNKKLIRKPTAFEGEYDDVDDHFFDQFDIPDLDEIENPNNNDDKIKKNENEKDEIEEEKENKEDDEKDDEKEENENDDEEKSPRKRSKSKSPRKKSQKSRKEMQLQHQSYMYLKKEKENISDDQNNHQKINFNEEENEQNEKIIVGKITFVEEITKINEENATKQPPQSDLKVKSILKEPTPAFNEGPCLSSISENYKNDPENIVFKENSKQRIVRAGRNLIRTLTVY